jgi:chromosome partitioning protein
MKGDLKMGIVISVNSLKGGCGKTTTVQSLAAALELQGNRCLVIDFDPQCNLTYASHAGIEDYDHNIYEFVKGECRFDEAYMVTEFYDIIPGEFSLKDFAKEFSKEGNEYILRNALEPLRLLYDYILIDTPTNCDILIINSLTACDYVIVPVEQSFYTFIGLELLFDMIKDVQECLNKNLNILGLLRVRYTDKAVINRFLNGLTDRFVNENGIKLFDVIIRESSVVCLSQGLGKSIVEFSPKSKPSIDYIMLANQIDIECGDKIKNIV